MKIRVFSPILEKYITVNSGSFQVITSDIEVNYESEEAIKKYNLSYDYYLVGVDENIEYVLICGSNARYSLSFVKEFLDAINIVDDSNEDPVVGSSLGYSEEEVANLRREITSLQKEVIDAQSVATSYKNILELLTKEPAHKIIEATQVIDSKCSEDPDDFREIKETSDYIKQFLPRF